MILTLSEAWQIRGHLAAIERRNGHSQFDDRLHNALTILERAMGLPPKRELITAVQWDREHPGEDFNLGEVEWRLRMRAAYEEFSAQFSVLGAQSEGENS